ncbi:MAG: hypothetical protein ACK4RK_22130, partial [Gemmataceae bacterium]
MSALWVPPRPGFYLRSFLISLGLIAVSLIGFLCGVHLEAKVPASATITALELREMRATLPGLVEPGWYEGQVEHGGALLAVRLDHQGNGHTDPAAGPLQRVFHHEVNIDGQRRIARHIRFHRLQAGDELWPGQVLALIRNDELRERLSAVEDQIKELESRGEQHLLLDRERQRLQARLAQGVMTVPSSGARWLTLAVRVQPLQAVAAGEVVALCVPIDPHTRRPTGLVARLDVQARHTADLAPGQKVRLDSEVFNHRLFGHAEAEIERIEPWPEATAHA